jgi:hypothetical protein
VEAGLGRRVHRARDDRDDTATSRLRTSSACARPPQKTAAVCADCFTPLAPTASVTLTSRWSHHTPASYHQYVGSIPAHDHWLDVPICLSCWLVDLSRPQWPIRGLPQRGREDDPLPFDQEGAAASLRGLWPPIAGRDAHVSSAATA